MTDNDQIWEEIRALRAENKTDHDKIYDEVQAVRSRTDKLEARAGIIGAIVALAVSAGGDIIAFFQNRGSH